MLEVTCFLVTSGANSLGFGSVAPKETGIPGQPALSEKIRVFQRKSEKIRVNQSKSGKIRDCRRGGGVLDRLGFIILSVLRTNGATNTISSMSVYEIMQAENFSQKGNTIYKKMKGFEQSGYIRRGLKEGRAATFYITPEGCDLLESEKISAGFGRPDSTGPDKQKGESDDEK